MRKESKFFATVTLTAAMLASLAAGPAYANCAPSKSVEDEFIRSSVVFMGTVIASRREPIHHAGYPKIKDFIEFADFQVDVGWKGVQPGEIVHFKTSSASGETYNTLNDPSIMLWEKPKWAAKKLRPPMTASNTWIIFALGKSPYELSACTRSLPVNWQPPSLAADLDKLTRKMAQK